MGLDLYAKIEPLLGFEDEKRRLYFLYIKKLQELGLKEVVDIGCGSGAFMQLAQKEGLEIVGLDLSQEMVKRAKRRGLKCFCKDICDFKGSFEGAVAVFDVMNYIPPNELSKFLQCVAALLKDGGYFLADINTLFGFEDVAQGSLWIDKEERFVAVEAMFEEGRLQTHMVYFEKEDGCYKKYSDSIVQYYHEVTSLKQSSFTIVDIELLSLFGEEADKALVILRKG